MDQGQTVVVVGGGIVGLAVAAELTARGHRVTVVEKEARWAAHQTGRNSGVVHSGLYYRPGSLKATMCRAGAASMVAFARANDVPVEVCGKLVVAVDETEVPRLRALADRAAANGVPVRWLDRAAARRVEPEVAAVAALRVESTGITDYRAVCAALAGRLAERGADLRTGAEVVGIVASGTAVTVTTTRGDLAADALVNCAGLHSDRVAALAGVRTPVRIVPFRGEYHQLRPERRDLVRGLVYPVPDPRLPFLGVHLTRMIDGSVHAGPNAVLATAREGYRRRDFDAREVAGIVAYPGFRRLAARQARTGVVEAARSLSRRRFAAALRRLVPAIDPDDLLPCPAGVRAQALAPDGSLVDDFLIETAPRQVHVLNAPSPAATSALEIAAAIADRLPGALRAA